MGQITTRIIAFNGVYVPKQLSCKNSDCFCANSGNAKAVITIAIGLRFDFDSASIRLVKVGIMTVC